MDINIVKGDKVIVEISGRVDTATAPEFSAAINEVVSLPQTVVFDCKELDYISSSGLRVILAASKSLKAAGGSLEVINVQPSVQSVFDMTGFSVMLNIHK